jgi:hypothetical protein
MCMEFPSHEVFRKHVVKLVSDFEAGLRTEYNHQDSNCCVVGLALADAIGQPLEMGDSNAFLAKVGDPRLQSLYNTMGMTDPRDQKEGAMKARDYLIATKELENV